VVSVGIAFFKMVDRVEEVMAQGNAMGPHAIL
jgi:hypothetical protein